jgi:hypothetical protein
MAARTIRVFWRNARTNWYNFNWPGIINQNSVVHISACEFHYPREPFFGSQGVLRSRGAAHIWVKNVRPHSRGVEFVLQVDWRTPLHVTTDITVFNPPEQEHFT